MDLRAWFFALLLLPTVTNGHELCGTSWKEEYTALHADIRAGKRAPRYVVSVTVESGLADRLTGLITQFYYSVFSRRALVVLDIDPLPPLNSAFDWANVNLTSPPIDSTVYHNLRRHYVTGLNYTGDRNYTDARVVQTFHPEIHVNRNPLVDFWYMRSNLSQMPLGKDDVPFLMTVSNRGRSIALFENSFHRQQLLKWGLRPDLAFYCAFNFLFKPNQQILDAVALAPVMGDANTLKIGIHIRTGDWNLHRQAPLVLADYTAHFECAKDIEGSRKIAGQNVVWYLMSDNLSLKKAAKEMYGDKLVTDLSAQPIHTACRPLNSSDCSNERLSRAFATAAAEMILFGKADYHVLTINSGFGRLAALLNPGWNHVYEVSPKSPRPCGVMQHTHLESLATTWSGVK